MLWYSNGVIHQQAPLKHLDKPAEAPVAMVTGVKSALASHLLPLSRWNLGCIAAEDVPPGKYAGSSRPSRTAPSGDTLSPSSEISLLQHTLKSTPPALCIATALHRSKPSHERC
ncbi:hypothetical protein NQZ68_040528 [Dissostichus eleginoides]|nr:hypothetical protein NQZ68_040528 [Dissostichus eleginoides]